MRGRRQDTQGGGLTLKRLFKGTVSTFKENELYHCDTHKILHIIDITYILVTLPIKVRATLYPYVNKNELKMVSQILIKVFKLLTKPSPKARNFNLNF